MQSRIRGAASSLESREAHDLSVTMTTSLSAPGDTPAPTRFSGRAWLLSGLALAVILLLLVFVVPRLLYPPLPDERFAGISDDKRIELETARLKLQNDARATLLQALGGGVLLLGAVFTWLQIRLSREQLQRNAEATRKQLALDREGQITERFTHAIDQLDTTAHGTDVTLGGIYALERIARDSHVDRATIGEVLTAYIRGHSPWPARLDEQPPTDAPFDEILALKSRDPDVQAALTVLGRGRFPAVYRPGEGLDLSNTDLRRATLRATDPQASWVLGVHFEYADFSGACLDHADLTYGYFEWANFGEARLACANLTGAHLESAHLVEAKLACVGSLGNTKSVGAVASAGAPRTDLEGRTQLGAAHLDGADLRGADLREVNLSNAFLVGALLIGADLRDAILHGASLHGANLNGAQLDGAELDGAHCDAETRWPTGFDWKGRDVDETARPANPRAHAVRFNGVQEDFAASMSTSREPTEPG